MSKEKKRVLERRMSIDLTALFHGRSLEDVTADFYKMSHTYEEEIFTHDKQFVFVVDHYGYDGGMDLYLEVYRWETDKELQKRLDKEAEAKAKAKKIRDAKKEKALKKALETEAEEYALYQKLAAKFSK